MQYLKDFKISFSDFVGQESAKLALLLNLIETASGGVLLAGKRGTGKSTLLKAFKTIVKALKIPFIELPMNATEEAVLGGIDIEETVKTGHRRFQKGLLSKADGGFLVIEDINLFPRDIVSIIFEVQSRAENIIEREGIKLREPAEFQILATMNPEEADFSSHFLDRFGMCVIMDEINEKEKRKEIIKLNLTENREIKEDIHLIEKLKKSREFIKKVKVSDEIKDFISELVLKEAVSGHRADIFLLYASKAYAAYLGDDFVKQEHVITVAPLVLNHRKKLIEQHEEHEHQHESDEAQNSEKDDKKNNNLKQNPPPMDENTEQGKLQNTPSYEKEEVFPVGESYKIKRFFFRKDRILRQLTGRRTKTKAKGRGGRYVRSLIQKRDDIAIDATVRAAAPFQKIRGMKDSLIIKDDDLRYREKERRMSHTVVFVVDGSGSMGVAERMIATKGAILSLLMDCYQKRDKVSMILFRKDRAETILPPTSSVELALKRLKEIPTGGKTPLSAGLMEAYKLMKIMHFKEPQSRLLIFIITDGKANVSLSDKSVFEELKSICFMLKDFPSSDFIVIDTEKKDKFMKMDLAGRIAEWLQARYFLIDELKSENLLSIVKAFKF
ncbi:VWA domain-containing protein [Thermodesulfovibrio sp. 3907-1M]|uniref:VWA domain-containing protein n=1 Tax=Thermodesulfovibrio autotrophicus TaxID=3118333 RepID=A0AAU8GXE1_9BACT